MKSKKETKIELILIVAFLFLFGFLIYLQGQENEAINSQIPTVQANFISDEPIEQEYLTKYNCNGQVINYFNKLFENKLIYFHSDLKNDTYFIYEIAYSGGLRDCRKNINKEKEYINNLCTQIYVQLETTPYFCNDIELRLVNEYNTEQILLISINGYTDYYLNDYSNNAGVGGEYAE